MASVFDFTADDLEGRSVTLSDYRGQVLLVVNTASFCGFTPQYGELADLHMRLSPDGFSVLAFPCNQFGAQEPGTAQEIAAFCRSAYPVTFPVFAKIDVRGPNAHPLFAYLSTARPGVLGSRAIKWNFTKFLIDRSGAVRRRFAPRTRPSAIERHIRLLL